MRLSSDFSLDGVVHVHRRFNVVLSAKQTSTAARSVVGDDDVDVQNVGGSTDRRLRFETAAKERSEMKKNIYLKVRRW